MQDGNDYDVPLRDLVASLMTDLVSNVIVFS